MKMGDWRDTKWAFLDGKIIPIDKANLSIRTCLLHYGTGIFEGIRAYWDEEQEKMYIFRAKEHYERMISNAKIIAMDVEYTIEELIRISVELLKKENFRENTYIRPLAYYNSLNLMDKLTCDKYGFFIYTFPMGDILDKDKGLNVCVSSWTRLNDNMIAPRGKIAGTYVNLTLVLYDAKLSGYDDAIILTKNGYVAEGAGQNIVIVRKNKIISPPVTDDILEGITLDSVTTIVEEELGMSLERRHISRTELYQSEEIFYCGTGCQITPIISVDHRKIGDGKPGNNTKRIQDIFFNIVKGKNEKYKHWLTEVK
jgi:branched-chain amino acid aminotransferase